MPTHVHQPTYVSPFTTCMLLSSHDMTSVLYREQPCMHVCISTWQHTIQVNTPLCIWIHVPTLNQAHQHSAKVNTMYVIVSHCMSTFSWCTQSQMCQLPHLCQHLYVNAVYLNLCLVRISIATCKCLPHQPCVHIHVTFHDTYMPLVVMTWRQSLPCFQNSLACMCASA